MSKEYKDLKSVIGKYNKVIVTGPHGAGNKIMTKIISKDFNLPEVRGEYAWDLNGYDKQDAFNISCIFILFILSNVKCAICGIRND